MTLSRRSTPATAVAAALITLGHSAHAQALPNLKGAPSWR